MKRTIYFTSCALVLAFVSCNSNKDSKDAADSVNRVKAITTNVMARGTLGVKVSDAEFATKVASDGMAEIEWSKIALENTVNVHLKYFARTIINDYSKINKELASIAAKKKKKTFHFPSRWTMKTKKNHTTLIKNQELTLIKPLLKP
ncbi:DUF4142 domain-containing protein [Pedobacter sp. NJ-S-72]